MICSGPVLAMKVIMLFLEHVVQPALSYNVVMANVHFVIRDEHYLK